MEGDGPLVVRQKFHQAAPIPIDQALLEMELVGHDFYLFHDIDEDMPSVVYRRRGYQYGVIRLVENRPDAVPASRRPAGSEVADSDLAVQPTAMFSPDLSGPDRGLRADLGLVTWPRLTDLVDADRPGARPIGGIRHAARRPVAGTSNRPKALIMMENAEGDS